MTTQEWIDDSSFALTPEDNALFEAWTKDLPPSQIGHCAAHSIRGFRYALSIARPSMVLEIGFNRGHSAVIMLELGVESVVSVEISDAPEVVLADSLLRERYKRRFRLVQSDSKVVNIEDKFDMIFIDGDHSYDGVISDIRLGQKLGIKWFLFDDWQPRFAATQEAIASARLIPLAIFGNLALCISGDGWEVR